MIGCEWCAGAQDDPQDPEALCETHLAEYEGLSVHAMRHRDAERHAGYAEWVLGR